MRFRHFEFGVIDIAALARPASAGSAPAAATPDEARCEA